MNSIDVKQTIITKDIKHTDFFNVIKHKFLLEKIQMFM